MKAIASKYVITFTVKSQANSLLLIIKSLFNSYRQLIPKNKLETKKSAI